MNTVFLNPEDVINYSYSSNIKNSERGNIMNDIEFKIDKENKVIVCKLKDCENIAWRRIDKYLDIHDFENHAIKNTYIGVAKCRADDEWNEEYGKKLALLRARTKRAKDINRELKNYIQKIQRGIDNISTYGLSNIPDIEAEMKDFVKGENK